MNIIFITLCRITDIKQHGIYTDLIRKMSNEGHKLFIVTPSERRFKIRTCINEQDGITILNVRTLNIQKTNVVEKGIGTISIQYQFNRAIEKYLNKVKFDLVLYSTPPITLTKTVSSIKKRTGAGSYLLLKDIFPQNAVDLGMLNRGLLYWYFKKKEKKLYDISDFIGCMSPANVRFIRSNYPELNSAKVEVCPNSIEISTKQIDNFQKKAIRAKFNIPFDSIVFIYGGNLGKPQGLDFLLEVIGSNQIRKNVFFIVIGSGTEWARMRKWFDVNNPENAILLPELPHKEYVNLVQACDVGLIFLDKRFTIPNYPSRLLTYMEYKMPLIAATDLTSDVGSIAVENGYGLWSLSGDLEKINRHIAFLAADSELRKTMGESAYKYLKENYTVDNTYNIIIKHFLEKVGA
jgi:glycosyltransferase involved in cell wall biosynthesis